MPTYEYECNTCGHHFEKFQSMSDVPLETCPECGGQVRRLLGTGAGLIIKGGSATSSSSIACGRSQTCCGREERCEKPPCSK
jgi:putative FmdB family regulatory protein